MKHRVIQAIIVCVLLIYSGALFAKNNPTRQVPTPIYGVSIDSTKNLNKIIASLRKLPYKPTVRVVFDEHIPPQHYLNAVKKLHEVSYVMGLILDSSAHRQYTVTNYRLRTERYVKLLSPYVDIWEIGNEVNGRWLGVNGDVITKLQLAYSIVKEHGGKTAVTFFYNTGCTKNGTNELFSWVEKHMPYTVKKGIDYAFISYHPDDCPGRNPNWQHIFTRLHGIFPQAKIGFGELGTPKTKDKAKLIRKFYQLKINVPNYVGGYFWWYYRQDMVPHSKPLWRVLYRAMLRQHRLYKSMN